MSSVISFNDVSLRFGGVQALKNVSFEIEENSLFAIIGPNGAGKTSILNCINGIYKPTSGSINIFDQDSKDLHLTILLIWGCHVLFKTLSYLKI